MVNITTEETSFFPCDGGKAKLFCVNEGLPLVAALEQSSVLLSAALGTAINTAHDDNTREAWATVYLIQMAAAVIEAATPRPARAPESGARNG